MTRKKKRKPRPVVKRVNGGLYLPLSPSRVLIAIGGAAAAAMSLVVFGGWVQGTILAPVRAEAAETARSDSLKFELIIGAQNETNETLSELVQVMVAPPEQREAVLYRLQAKYIISAGK